MPAVTLQELADYVGTDVLDDFLESCLSAGTSHVERFIGTVETVPGEVHRQATFICSSELFHRRSAPNGISQFASMDGTAVRVARDPMTAVYPLLQPYVGWSV
jgi:hypothetical protein